MTASTSRCVSASGTIIAMSRVIDGNLSSSRNLTVPALAAASRWRVAISSNKDRCGGAELCAVRGASCPAKPIDAFADENLRRESETRSFCATERKALSATEASIAPLRSKKSSLRRSTPRQCAAPCASPEQSKASVRDSPCRQAARRCVRVRRAARSSRLRECCAPARRAIPAKGSAAARRGLRSTDCATRPRPARTDRCRAESTRRCALPKTRARSSRCRMRDSKSKARSALR